MPTDGPEFGAGTPVGTSTLARRVAVAVAALAGAAAAATALAAPAAASTSDGGATWNRVAGCESSQNWHIDTGNGYYGGLQFSSSTWAAFGGHKYAGQANNASRVEQIAVARRVLAEQGPGAWPVCGPRGGLTRSSGHATSAALPAHPAERASSKSDHEVRPAAHASPTTAPARKTTPAAEPPAAKHGAKHASRATYRVHSGDTLSSIARREHVHGGWHALYRANRSTISNPDVIHVGQVLHLP